MEHKVITGGEHWLPFARSRIKALQATGLAYASQKFEIEGALVEVRIEPGHEYIRIRGGVPEAYLETGVLTWQFRGLDDPLWGEAAKWRFTDIPTTSKYLGKIVSGGEDVGEQRNKPPLVDDQDSLAIGYPKAKSGSAPERETKDAETEKKYRDSTYAKKKLMGALPASVFSGKMRLYMQSLYGAREVEQMEDSPFIFDESGPVPVGMFRGRAEEGGNSLLIRPYSMGIFTAPDNTYWLLDINEGTGKVLVFKINTDKVRGLVESLTFNTQDREKIESYIFANSRLEIHSGNSQLWAAGSFPTAPGASLAYGWKWNEDGSKASVVLHEELGGDVISEIRWHSRTIHLTISYTESAGVAVAGEVVDHNDWIDGWGAYNIFVPPSESAYSPLVLKSLRAGAGLIPPDIEFPFTPIYGWYVDGIWTPVEISSTLTPRFEHHAESSGVVYPYGGACPQYPSNPFNQGAVESTGYEVLSEQTTFNGGRKFKFGTFAYDGESRALNTSSVSWTTGGGDQNTPYQTSEWVEQWSGDAGGGYPSSSSFNQVYSSRPPYPPYVSLFRNLWTTHAKVAVSKTGDENRKFVVVIPGGDSEALYLATRKERTQGDVVTTTSGYWSTTKWVFYDLGGGSFVDLGEYRGWRGLPWTVAVAPGASDSWSPDGGATTVYGPPTTEVTDTLEPELETNVHCFNREVHGVEGTPGGSYEGLFNCAYTHPQYDRGMYTYTSNGGRYSMSEAPSKPFDLPGTEFVGWA